MLLLDLVLLQKREIYGLAATTRVKHIIYKHLYNNAHYFLKLKKEKFGPILEKSNIKHSVNSVNENEHSKTEPSLLLKGAETRNGESKE